MEQINEMNENFEGQIKKIIHELYFKKDMRKKFVELYKESVIYKIKNLSSEPMLVSFKKKHGILCAKPMDQREIVQEMTSHVLKNGLKRIDVEILKDYFYNNQHVINHFELTNLIQ